MTIKLKNNEEKDSLKKNLALETFCCATRQATPAGAPLPKLEPDPEPVQQGGQEGEAPDVGAEEEDRGAALYLDRAEHEVYTA